MRRAKITAALAVSATMLLGVLGASPASAALGIVPAGQPGGFLAETESTQAGAHPSGVTSFTLTPPPPQTIAAGTLKDTVVDLPAGLAGDPGAVPRCETLLAQDEATVPCAAESQIGTVDIRYTIDFFGSPSTVRSVVPLWNVEPGPGRVADFQFTFGGVPITTTLQVTLRPEDYGVRVRTRNASTFFPVEAAKVTVWGVPADPSHDEQRCLSLVPEDPFDELNSKFLCIPNPNQPQGTSPQPFIGPRLPFLSNPTACDAPKETRISVSGWEEPGVFSAPESAFAPTPTGCDQLDFQPTIEAEPTTDVADSPSGLDFKLHIPQNEDPDGLAPAHLKDAVVTLPQGMTVNPSSAAGLGACSLAQIGLKNGDPVACPDASRLGTATAVTPALENPVGGAVYLAKQDENPFGSLIALYLVLEDKERGLLVKLPGEAKADPQTGQITTTFKDNPQLPVEDIELHLKQGARAPLRTPATCGAFTTTSDLTPWATPEVADATPSDSFDIAQGAGGSPCVRSEPEAPNSPSFTAGTVDPTAGAYTPFALKLARADGTQPIKAIDTTLPKGLVGKLAGIPYCPEAALAAAAAKSGRSEQASPACPSASEVGTVNVAAGAGPAPLNVTGKAYLAGPYKGAPLSLAVITPAVAGPFDLGTVVVRTALRVDPASAQIHAVSDEIPTILQGIPLDVRSISLNMARPKFTLNPTSCDPTSITGSALSAFGQVANLSNPFQVGDCGRLGFKPRLSLRLKGGTKRSDNPALTATLTYPEGAYANIGSASVALPHSEFLDQSHIGTVCTRPQFAADACPAKSAYGFARAFTPLLDQPLEGLVYLRSSNNPLPDLLVALKGQIEVDLAGRIDSVRGGIRTTFEGVPDAPVSKFVLMMKGGKKGLLVNSRDICKHDYRATAQFTAQNGKAFKSRPALKNGACKKAKKHRGKPHKKG